MDAWVWIVIAAAIVILAAIVFWSVRRVRQRRDLRDWFSE
jgi:HAMP domain-containing protein